MFILHNSVIWERCGRVQHELGISSPIREIGWLASYNQGMSADVFTDKLKGVVLAGGFGTRLLPMTRVINKHLLPVYDRPMVFYPLRALVLAGIDDVLLVTGGNHSADFSDMLGDGSELGLSRISYAYQEGAGGVADALRLAEDFADGQPIVMMLGDNLVQYTIQPIISAFVKQLDDHGGRGARVVLTEVDDPQHFGVVETDDNDNIIAIREKPQQPASNLVAVGIYLYDECVFEIIRTLKPSVRGELEITDVNNHYLREGLLGWSHLEGWWSDAGTVRSLYRASQLVADYGANGEGPARLRYEDDPAN